MEIYLEPSSKKSRKEDRLDPIRGQNKIKASPFLKWVGGKRSIIAELKKRLPEKFEKYHEPFLGGAALFFEIAPQKSFLSDANLDLILAYKTVQKDPEQLINLLKEHQKNHSEEYYYQIRSQHHLDNPIAIAARVIYLNKTCFNGLWRVNRKGEFNVPIGSYVNPGICQEETIMACSKDLSKAVIHYKEYSKIEPTPGDFVYFDPPYHPTNQTSFTSYSKLDFTENNQKELASFCLDLHKKGVKIMLSNSNTKFIRELYNHTFFNTAIINAPRLVNCKPGGRTPVEEVLITNY